MRTIDKTILVDFDRVIHDTDHPLLHKKMGAPIEGAGEAIRLLQVKGYRVVIFTVRANSEHGIQVVEDWLNYYMIPYDEVTNIKQNADWYVDDKAIRFYSWDDVLKQV